MSRLRFGEASASRQCALEGGAWRAAGANRVARRCHVTWQRLRLTQESSQDICALATLPGAAFLTSTLTLCHGVMLEALAPP